MIAAGIGDNSAPPLLLRKRSNFVVGSPEFERADRLEVFGFKIKLAAIFDSVRFMEVRRNQLCADGDASQARLRFANIAESDDGTVSAFMICILSGEQTSLHEVRSESKALAASVTAGNRGPSTRVSFASEKRPRSG